ncbi:hypothetical protein DOY81_004357 [Sarcophaga bullata]|nr:hypothetical protein DOY81_004357 [Sarcophaga bullata]
MDYLKRVLYMKFIPWWQNEHFDGNNKWHRNSLMYVDGINQMNNKNKTNNYNNNFNNALKSKINSPWFEQGLAFETRNYH